ncbi:MAG TPA: DNA polymerase IV [Anaerolineales bacterium]|nr:DNA polymerase IV [Anaerolineales bacterium]
MSLKWSTTSTTNKSRVIIHLDLDAFYCAVEEQRDPTLHGKPFAVGGQPESRGVVSSCSYAARQFGVRSAMPMSRAVRICPGLQVVSPHFDLYRAASRKVMERLHALTPLVEQISIDEAFLDGTDLTDDPDALAHNLQQTILTELGLPCSLGVAINKLVAKIASDFGKGQARGAGPPNAITVVPPGSEAEFLSPLPVERLWGVGPKTAARLNKMGIATIGDLARTSPTELSRLFGKHGEDMSRRAQGIDDSPIVTVREAKSFSQEETFARDVGDPNRLRALIEEQAKSLAYQLQKQNLTATTIKLKIRWPNFTTLTRQTTLSQAFDDSYLIAQTAWMLLEKIWQPGKRVRLLGVGVSGLAPRPRQLGLWEDE